MNKLVRQMFGRGPREFASPQRIVVENHQQLLATIDQHNGLTHCYVGAYAFASDERSYGDVIINKAIFDFDEEWESLVKTHEWLEERDAAHVVVFSGSDESGHLYVLTEPTKHQQSLEYFQRNVVIDGAGLRTCGECGSVLDRSKSGGVAAWWCGECERSVHITDTALAVDENLVGDPATMIRVPNTWHPKAERFCVPLKPDEVTMDIESVYELSRSQRDLGLSDVVSGSKTVVLDQHTEAAEKLYTSYSQSRRLAGFDSDAEVIEEFEVEVKPERILESMECECLLAPLVDEDGSLIEPEMGHRDRRVLVSYLVEQGYNPKEIAAFVMLVLDDAKAQHSVFDEEQPVRIWRDGVRAPNATTLKRMGLHNQFCPVHNKAVTAEQNR